MADLEQEQSKLGVEVRRAPYGKLTIYEISEQELVEFERGSPTALLLNFAIFSLSTALTFFSVLLTTSVSGKTFIIFLTITILGMLGGAFLFIWWLMTRKSITNLADVIRKRLPPEGQTQDIS